MTKAKASKGAPKAKAPKDIADIALNPIRIRIIQTLAMNDELTAAQIGEAMTDVSRTTLYRHINTLIDAGLVTVVSEKKIRGSIERTLALNAKELQEQMSATDPTQEIFKFLMGTYVKFQKYFARDDIDPMANKIFINNAIMMMTDEEFDQFLTAFRELSQKYYFEGDVPAGTQRKPRDITTISAPSTVFDAIP